MSKELIKHVSEYIKAADKAVMEAAHIYADQSPNGEQSAGAVVAAKILENLSRSTHKVLLIDDFHPEQSSLDLEAYHFWLASYGFTVDQTFMESALVPDAFSLLAKIQDSVPKKKLSYSKENAGIGLWTPRGKISLLTQSGQPSCNLLDASFYLRKTELGDIAVTILPQTYLAQQLDTLAILQRIGHGTPIVNVFFDPAEPLENVSIRLNREME